MWAFVTPSARQCGPPELLATLPPIEHVCWLLGSGAKCRPCDGDGTRLRSRLSTPGSTHARRAAASTDRMRFIFVVEMTIAPSGGTAPPARPVPEPRATNGTPCRLATSHAGLHLGGRRREAHGDGGALHVRGVVAVQRQLGRPVAHPVGAERRAEVGDERRRRRRERGRAHSARSGRRIRITRAGLDRLAVDEHLVAGVEVVAEAHEPPVALGAQLPLARRAALPALPDGVGDALARSAHRRRPAPRGDVRRAPARRAVADDLALGVPGAGRAGGDTADEPDRRAASRAPPQPADGPRRAGGQPGGLDHRDRQRRAGDPARPCRRRR